MAGNAPGMRARVETIALLALAAFLYAGMMGSLLDAPGSDAIGRGLAVALAGFLGLALWFVLAALLLVAAVKRLMPVWAMVGAAVLLPLSYIALCLAGDAYAQGDRSAIWMPALLPVLFALYALWTRLPRLHGTFRAGATGIVLGGAIAVLSLIPLVAEIRASLPDPARDARLAEQARMAEEQRAREQQQAREREEAQFASLGPDSNLEDYLIYLSSMAYRDRALVGIRRLNNRQAEAIALLQRGRIGDLHDLPEFDLAPTAELCAAYGDALAGAAGKVTKARSDYLIAAMDLELQVPTMKWLIANGCDLGGPLALAEGNVRAVADSSRMTAFADTLAGLRRAK